MRSAAAVGGERDLDVGALVFDLADGAAATAVDGSARRRSVEPVGAHGDQACRRASMTLWPPMKRATNSVRGRLKTSRGEPCCSIRPSFITHHEVGQRHRLVLAVGDMDEGDAELALQPLQLGAHPEPQERVERRKRLVQQQDLRLGDQRAGQRHALLLAAGELRRQARRIGLHVDELEQLAGARRGARPWRRRASSGQRRRCRARLRCGNSA